MSPAVTRARTRLKPEERALQILDAAAALIVEQGIFPIPLEALSQRIGISKGLIYSYFPTQYDLANHLLRHELSRLAAAELALVLALNDLETTAAHCSELYFEHVADRGPLLHILLSDPHLAGRMEPGLISLYSRVMGRLARRLRDERRLTSKEAVAAVNILAAIPEELGNLTYLKRLDRALGRELCREMVLGGVDGLSALPPVSPSE